VNSIPVVKPAHGTVVLNADGTFIYTPNALYNGSDEFAYEICDNGSPVACDQGIVHILLAVVDYFPVAVDDNISVQEDSPLNGNVSVNDIPSLDGNNIWTIVKQPDHGTITMTTDGKFTYTPNPDFNGPDSFVYKVCDKDGDCDEGTVKIVISPANDVPIAVDDVVTLNLDGVLSGNVSDNDLPSGDGGNIWSLVSPPQNGTIIFNADGSYSYTPNLNFDGTDVFTYKLCDTNGDCAQAKVTINMVDIIKPNQIFTPNADGQNDNYYIDGIELYPNNQLTVYNRWGNVVYQKSGYNNDWDGYSNMKKIGKVPLPVGTYYIVLEYGNKKHKTGYVYLDR
jgi:gliding motility-associated-like protein